MEKLSSLNLSFDKVLIQLIIPGLIAIFPWFLVYISLPEHKNARHYFYQNSTVTLTTLTFLALIAGLLLENFSSRLEVAYFDILNSKEDTDYYLPFLNFKLCIIYFYSLFQAVCTDSIV